MSPGKSCLCLVCLCFCCGPHFGLAPSLWLPDAAPLLGSPVFVLCLVVVVVVVVLVPVGSIWWLPVVDAAALLETGTPYSISPNGPWELLSCVLLLLLLWLLSSSSLFRSILVGAASTAGNHKDGAKQGRGRQVSLHPCGYLRLMLCACYRGELRAAFTEGPWEVQSLFESLLVCVFVFVPFVCFACL